MSHDTLITILYALVFGAVIGVSIRQYRRQSAWEREQDKALNRLAAEWMRKRP